MDRRQFLGALVPGVALACAQPVPRRRAPAVLRELAEQDGEPRAIARDESFWHQIQESFAVDRSLINLNSGGVSPSPASVQSSLARHLAQANACPARELFQIQNAKRETVRVGLAQLFGCDPEELAITRNTSEGLQICQFGFDLEPGDEVLTTNQDYGRMINTWKQRVAREGVVLRQLSLPVPAEDSAEVVRRFEAEITDRTRLILMCHMINLTGQILPVREVVRMARAKGIPVIVDGAHAFAHFPFERDDLECDYYATSLHKWLFAPFGTGMLYVRRERIPDLWPLMAAPESQRDDIRKFEEIGTNPVPNVLAIAEAMNLHRGIGPERKLARLVYLRDRWARRLLQDPSVRLHTSLSPGFAAGIATVQVEGVDTRKLTSHMWAEHRIVVTGIVHEEFEGLRISPSVFTTLDEIDRFADAMEGVIREGLPA